VAFTLSSCLPPVPPPSSPPPRWLCRLCSCTLEDENFSSPRFVFARRFRSPVVPLVLPFCFSVSLPFFLLLLERAKIGFPVLHAIFLPKKNLDFFYKESYILLFLMSECQTRFFHGLEASPFRRPPGFPPSSHVGAHVRLLPPLYR